MVFDRIIGGHGEDRLAYDLTRAHSADVFFLKMRAWFWGVTSSVVCFLLGNLLGAYGFDIFGEAWQAIKDTWEWI
jgi:hypothetical protein